MHQAPNERVREGMLVLGDLNGDRLLDAVVVGPRAEVQLLLQRRDGSFEDVTLRSGLDACGGATCALISDLDGDGRADLYLGSSEHRIWRNHGDATFTPFDGGIDHDSVDLRVEAVDHDADGLDDLLVHTEGGLLIYRARGRAKFERVELPPVASGVQALSRAPVSATIIDDRPEAAQTRAERRIERWMSGRPQGAATRAPGTGLGSTTGAGPAPSPSTAPSVGTTGAVSLFDLFDPRFVNDDQGEVDSADILDGSLTGADVSTSGGDVHFGGDATVTAHKGTFGEGNVAVEPGATVSGGSFNTAVGGATVSGGTSNSATGESAAIAGGDSNTASASYSSVGGGIDNRALGLHTTIAGGDTNSASSSASTISGGVSNSASGLASSIGGGAVNTATGFHATIAGGQANAASNSAATVSGGSLNTASGEDSTVPGGRSNEAMGSSSLAAGRRAKANHDGSFVWGDSVSSVDKTSSADDEFNIYAEGGLRMFADGQSTPSMVVAPDGNVGIGVTDPARTFHLRSLGDGVIRVDRASPNPAVEFNRYPDGDFSTTPLQTWQVGAEEGGFFIADSQAGETRLSIDATGNVDIDNSMTVTGPIRMGSETIPGADTYLGGDYQGLVIRRQAVDAIPTGNLVASCGAAQLETLYGGSADLGFQLRVSPGGGNGEYFCRGTYIHRDGSLRVINVTGSVGATTQLVVAVPSAHTPLYVDLTFGVAAHGGPEHFTEVTLHRRSDLQPRWRGKLTSTYNQ